MHREVKLFINKLLHAGIAAKIRENLKNTGDHCSQTELQADALERESIKIKMLEYFDDHIGSEFSGTVSGVVRTGLFVQIDEMLAEGFLPYSSFGDDYYVFDEEKHEAVGRRTKIRYRLGDKINVIVAGVDRERREMEFYPASMATRKSKTRSSKAKRKTKKHKKRK